MFEQKSHDVRHANTLEALGLKVLLCCDYTAMFKGPDLTDFFGQSRHVKVGRSSKLEELQKVLEDVGDQKTVVFTEFEKMLHLISYSPIMRGARDVPWALPCAWDSPDNTDGRLVMNGAYKVSWALFLLSWLSFLLFTWYHTDSSGYSWILYHPEFWHVSLYLAVIAAAAFLAAVAQDLKDARECQSVCLTTVNGEHGKC